ncbi:hypothetical protein H6P81_012578 [Aristolochia fimbriata]|uniref:VOC domain-containing protein n=1 Tax=Aristolochia fimbriata TaxID=158543 RepID=A0AAV7EC77_ARIFI|nr:hypothetical protein H6P81_012578 [Aristolochia fimbriata]
MAQEVDNGPAAENAPTKPLVFSALKPQICVSAAKANDAIAFYKAAFCAEELKRAVHPKRKAEQDIPLVLSCELQIGGSVFIVCDKTEECAAENIGFTFCLETEDVEAAVSHALKAGAVVESEISEDESGRSGKVKDPFGNIWTVCSASSQSSDAPVA